MNVHYNKNVSNIHSQSWTKFNVQPVVMGHSWVIEDGNTLAQSILECIDENIASAISKDYDPVKPV